MIQYINHLCNQWGMWCLTGRETLGYPRQTSFLNGKPQPSKGSALCICDEQALQVQRAINLLDDDLKKLVTLFYVKMRSCDGDTIARANKCATRTMYDRLHRAHQLIMFNIQEDELRR